MILSDLIGTSMEGVRRNKLRSLLTTLGIIIGVGSVVLMLSVGSSFEAYIFNQLEGISDSVIEVYPRGMEQFGRSLDTITFEDVDAIDRLQTTHFVTPGIFISDSIRYGREEMKPFIIGMLPPLYENYGMKVDKGRLIDERDVKGGRYVAVIGPDTAEELFKEENPLGKRVNIGSQKYTVIGVTKSMGSLTGTDMDKMVTIPFSVAKAVSGAKYAPYISLQAKGDVDLALADIKSLLRQRHKLDNPDDDPDKDDFIARSAEQATEILGTVTMSLTAFLALIAGISLVVGGIGIMNIMLVSVTERTKEIGLRKAVGARKSDILYQFLIEAIFLTLIGGFVGIAGGLFLAFILAAVANSFLGDFPFDISWASVLLATFMAVGTGLIFGIFPARKAANLSPMEAMRYE